MKPMGEIISLSIYHQYTDDIELNISAPGEGNNPVDVLSWFLGSGGVWMGNNRLQLNPDKTEWL